MEHRCFGSRLLSPSPAHPPALVALLGPRKREDSIHVAPLVGRTKGAWVPPGVAHSPITPHEALVGETSWHTQAPAFPKPPFSLLLGPCDGTGVGRVSTIRGPLWGTGGAELPSNGHGSPGLPLWLKVPGDGSAAARHQCFMRCRHQRRLPAWF